MKAGRDSAQLVEMISITSCTLMSTKSEASDFLSGFFRHPRSTSRFNDSISTRFTNRKAKHLPFGVVACGFVGWKTTSVKLQLAPPVTPPPRDRTTAPVPRRCCA